MSKTPKINTLDPAAICRSSDPLAVRELLTKIGDKWTIFVILSLELLGGRARFSELERAVPGISQRMLSVTLKGLERDGLVTREVKRPGFSGGHFISVRQPYRHSRWLHSSWPRPLQVGCNRVGQKGAYCYTSLPSEALPSPLPKLSAMIFVAK